MQIGQPMEHHENFRSIRRLSTGPFEYIWDKSTCQKSYASYLKVWNYILSRFLTSSKHVTGSVFSFFFRRLWAPTITRDSWGQWPDSEFGSRTPNTKLMVRRRPIFFRHIGGNYSTSSVHHARLLPSCSLRSIVLPENPCARSRFFEKMCRIFFKYFVPRKKLSA